MEPSLIALLVAICGLLVLLFRKDTEQKPLKTQRTTEERTQKSQHIFNSLTRGIREIGGYDSRGRRFVINTTEAPAEIYRVNVGLADEDGQAWALPGTVRGIPLFSVTVDTRKLGGHLTLYYDEIPGVMKDRHIESGADRANIEEVIALCLHTIQLRSAQPV